MATLVDLFVPIYDVVATADKEKKGMIIISPKGLIIMDVLFRTFVCKSQFMKT